MEPNKEKTKMSWADIMDEEENKETGWETVKKKPKVKKPKSNK